MNGNYVGFGNTKIPINIYINLNFLKCIYQIFITGHRNKFEVENIFK